MKRTKLVLGLSAVAAAFIMAFSTAPKANADILRESASPTSQILSESACGDPTPTVCAYIFTDVNDQTPNGTLNAEKL